MRFDEKTAVVSSAGFAENSTEDWFKKYRSQRDHAVQRGVNRELTFQDYLTLANEAGLKSPDQIGKSSEQYHLSRLGDQGDYIVGNCRFITASQNHVEAFANGRLDTRIEQQIGQTKETSERVRKMAESQTGKTKANNPGTAAQAEKLAKEFVLTAPDGTIHRGKNVVEFCKQHDLQHANLYKVFSGRKQHHKGWTGRYLESDK